MTKRRLLQIENRIKKIKTELVEIGEMRPGSLTEQYKGGNQTSGPYFQLSYTHEMKNRTNYIRKDCVDDIRQQVKNYKRFKDLTSEWVSLGIEHSQLSMKLKKEKS
jgi:hypothetical protein